VHHPSRLVNALAPASIGRPILRLAPATAARRLSATTTYAMVGRPRNGPMSAHIGLLRAYIGLLRAYIGLLRAYIGLLRAYIGLLRAYIGLLRAYIDLLQACKRPL
jgi:hypothetical protein